MKRSTPTERADRAAGAVATVLLASAVGTVCYVIPDGLDFFQGFTASVIVWALLSLLGLLGNRP